MPGDGLPIVGAVPDYKGVYLLVTHSGITLGPLLAQLVGDEIVTGRISPWLERYRPDRMIK
jgi:glycine/D-amino acid oxidase-like deaminating enzyme